MPRVFELSIPDYDRMARMFEQIAKASKDGRELPQVLMRNNTMWQQIGKKYGFDWKTARQAPGRSYRFVLAIPTGETK